MPYKIEYSLNGKVYLVTPLKGPWGYCDKLLARLGYAWTHIEGAEPGLPLVSGWFKANGRSARILGQNNIPF